MLHAGREVDGIATEREILVAALQLEERVLRVGSLPPRGGVGLDSCFREFLESPRDERVDPFDSLDPPAPVTDRLEQVQHPERERRDGILGRGGRQHLVRGGSHLRTGVRGAHDQVFDESRRVQDKVHRRRPPRAFLPLVLLVLVAVRAAAPARATRVPAPRAGHGPAARSAVAGDGAESFVASRDGVVRGAFFIGSVLQSGVLVLSVLGKFPCAVEPRGAVQRPGDLACVEEHASLGFLR